jgi:prolyl-tRNA editing enzyme YbaK/EbsC (Cys-tRNA(Pro) deacylase)
MKLSPEAQRVQKVLDSHGLKLEVEELPESTKTAKDAAKAIGCELGQIAKSLVFERKDGMECEDETGAILVIASGDNTVDVEKIAELVGGEVKLASSDTVHEVTGFHVGGVAPVAHTNDIPIYIDSHLESFDEIWAAAGTSHAVFRLTPEALKKITGGTVVEVG